LKTTREHLNMIDAFHELGSYRAAARLCGTTHKTVKKVVERQQAGGPWARRPRLTSRNTDRVMSVIWERVRRTDGRMSAKRPTPVARAAGYKGSARNLRRAVAKVKAEWRLKRRIFRPWVPSPGQHLVADWTKIAVGLHSVRTGTERAFIALGSSAEAFLRAAAAAGTSRLASELADILTLELSWSREQLLAALERATRFRRFKADDIRSILEAGPSAPNPVPAGAALNLTLPEVPVRPLSAYSLEAIR
jgi:hypothetical protein